MFKNPIITPAEIAAALGWSEGWFARKLPELIKRHGFPSPLPARRRWHAAAVERWFATYGEVATAKDQKAAIARVVERERNELTATYCGRAA